jgi:uncharacterized protein with PIN domain
MLGYDTVYYRGRDFHELLQIARQQQRVVLTRNTKLTARGVEGRVILVREDDPLLQLKELLNRGIVSLDERTLLSRCLLCNSVLDRISREEAEGKVPEFVFHLHHEFYRCPQCHQVYWPGSHPQRMEKRLKDLTRGQGTEGSRVQGVKGSSNQSK